MLLVITRNPAIFSSFPRGSWVYSQQLTFGKGVFYRMEFACKEWVGKLRFQSKKNDKCGFCYEGFHSTEKLLVAISGVKPRA